MIKAFNALNQNLHGNSGSVLYNLQMHNLINTYLIIHLGQDLSKLASYMLSSTKDYIQELGHFGDFSFDNNQAANIILYDNKTPTDSDCNIYTTVELVNEFSSLPLHFETADI